MFSKDWHSEIVLDLHVSRPDPPVSALVGRCGIALMGPSLVVLRDTKVSRLGILASLSYDSQPVVLCTLMPLPHRNALCLPY